MRDPTAPWRAELHCDEIVGCSEALARVLAEACVAARCDLPVLILGETGTGKNLLAQAVHDASRRGGRPMVKMHLTVPDTLVEAHVFGATRGAYTGAVRDLRGYVERADGSTLFIDEVGALSPLGQSKLLTLVQFGTWSPLGSTEVRHADVRVIAATSAPVDALPQDLRHRLGGFEIHMPSLAERVADVPLLAESVARRYAARRGLPSLELTAGAVQLLIARRWPGNVRELENVVRRGLERAWAERALVLEARHLGDDERPPDPRLRLWEQLDAFEDWLVRRALAAAGGNIGLASAMLGTSESWLYKRRTRRLRPRAA